MAFTDETGISMYLTAAEMVKACAVGCLVRINAMIDGRHDKSGQPKERRWQNDIIGHLGEAVLAKYLHADWDYQRWEGRAPDDVRCYEVRCTDYSDGGLIIRLDDKEDRPYVLVTGIGPRFILRGWLWALEVNDLWWEPPTEDRSGIWKMPQEKLHDMKDLPSEDDVLRHDRCHAGGCG